MYVVINIMYVCNKLIYIMYVLDSLQKCCLNTYDTDDWLMMMIFSEFLKIRFDDLNWYFSRISRILLIRTQRVCYTQSYIYIYFSVFMSAKRSYKCFSDRYIAEFRAFWLFAFALFCIVIIIFILYLYASFNNIPCPFTHLILNTYITYINAHTLQTYIYYLHSHTYCRH